MDRPEGLIDISTDGSTLTGLRRRLPVLREAFAAAKPFRYIVVDDFLDADFAARILDAYPVPDVTGWALRRTVHQKKKLSRRSGFPPVIQRFFTLSASNEFRELISDITGIRNLLADPDLVGGGLHQILSGGFLDVHVDYNFHPRTKLPRRLNLLVYMNREWKTEYGGCLELWDMQVRKQIELIAPLFNRAVIFETNEVSYHGHPHPMNTPPDVTRNSLAVYYYSVERDDAQPARAHNTIYRQTTGLSGFLKTVVSGLDAAADRVGRRLGWRGGDERPKED